MPTLQELERAFIAADEAGNTEDARVFAEEIRRMQQQGGQPQQAPAQASQPNPQFGQLKGSDLKSYGSGLVEGLQRVVAGGKQLSGAVSDFFTRNDKADRGAKEKFAAEEMLRAATAQAEAQQAGLDPSLREGMAAATQMGTLAVAPEVALPRATTVIGALAKNFTSGGIGGALTFEPIDPETGKVGSKLDDTVGGATSSALIGLVPSLAPAVKNVVGKGLARIASEGRTAARVASAEKALPNTTFSLAQRTGVPELSYLEHRAYNLDQVNFFADQTDQFIADAAKTLGQPIKAGQTLGGDAAVLKEAMDDHIGNIRKNASKTYEYGLSKAVTQAGPDNTIPVDSYRNAIREILPSLKSEAKVSKDFPVTDAYIADLERLAMDPSKTSLTVKELAQTLRELTVLQKSTNPTVKAFGTRLRNQGIEADLDNVAQLPTQSPAIQTILDTRAEYRRAMQLANSFSEATAYKLMDGASEPADMLARLKSYSPEKQANVRKFLEKHSPDMLRSLKQEVVNDAVRSSGVIREAADAQQDLSKFQNALFDGDTFRASGLFSGDELKRAEGIADGLRVIQNNRPMLTSAGTPVAPEDVAINLISRSGPFMARFITRALTSSKASQFFTDPNIYQMMTKLDRSTTGSATNLAMRAALMSYLQENYGEEESGSNQQ